MSRVTAVYSRGFSIGSLLIRHADRFGSWSHCGLLTPEGTVIEARAFHGVVETPFAEFANRASHYWLRDIECPNPEAAIAWYRSQIGKGYDYLAIFGLLFRNSWQSDNRWHCAEGLEMALVYGNRRRFRWDAWRISPNMSWVVE